MTEQEALEYPGHIFRHYKGGIYRYRYKIPAAASHNAGNMVALYSDGEPTFCKITDDVIKEEYVVIYEHLWPHDRECFMRPERSWNEPLEDGSPRFVEIKNDY